MSTVKADKTLAEAVDMAREAACSVADPGMVGEHLRMRMESDRLATHFFRCEAPAYVGWEWSVTVARIPRSKKVTVCEAHLLPGDDAVLAPPWVPYSDRLAPGDLRPGDVLPHNPHDTALMQGYESVGDDEADAVAVWELGLGRERVLSPGGRDAAAQRWIEGEHGPASPMAKQASKPCSSCGYFIPMAGALRQSFGVCAHEWSPSDGRVVSIHYGCGAHSETDAPQPPRDVLPPLLLDDEQYEPAEQGENSEGSTTPESEASAS